MAKLSGSRKTKLDEDLIEAYIGAEWRDMILTQIGGYNHPVLVDGIEV
jgi:hypothetical protein